MSSSLVILLSYLLISIYYTTLLRFEIKGESAGVGAENISSKRYKKKKTVNSLYSGLSS